MAWREHLMVRGVTVAAADAEHVFLRDEEHPDQAPCVMTLRIHQAPVHPSTVPERAAPASALLVVPSITEAALKTALQRGWNVVTDDGTVELRLHDRHVRARPEKVERPARKRGRVGWGQWSVVRTLLALPAASLPQVVVADAAGVSQPTVFRVLNSLRERGLVEPGRSQGARVTDRHMLTQWWLANYPGPGGVDTYWYSLDPVMQQTTHVARMSPGCVISGAGAADMLAPWQRPDQLRVYVNEPTLMTEAGFVPVSCPDEATMIVTAPVDPGVWPPHPAVRKLDSLDVAFADPLQIVFDVKTSTRTDRATATDAAEHLLRSLEGQLRETWSATRRADL